MGFSEMVENLEHRSNRVQRLHCKAILKRISVTLAEYWMTSEFLRRCRRCALLFLIHKHIAEFIHNRPSLTVRLDENENISNKFNGKEKEEIKVTPMGPPINRVLAEAVTLLVVRPKLEFQYMESNVVIVRRSDTEGICIKRSATFLRILP